MNTELAAQLLRMAEEDERVRTELAATGELFQGYAPRMAEVHQRNAAALEAIIEEFGWPGKILVGPKGVEAAWLILQHAIGNPALQRRSLPLLRQAASRSEIEPAQVAYLEDRICFFERRPQRYGTQFDWDENGELSPWTLEDATQVDELRRTVGLGPLSEKIEEMRRNLNGETPPDFHQRQQELMEWAKSVGWL